MVFPRRVRQKPLNIAWQYLDSGRWQSLHKMEKMKKKETNKLSERFENGIWEADALNQGRMETPVAYFVNYIPDS